jgi:DNA polymerase II small subunit
MDIQNILKSFLQKGLLVDKEVLNLFSETEDTETIKFIIEKVGVQTQKRIITKNLFEQNKEKINQIVSNLPESRKKNIEKLKFNLGLSIEIEKEVSRPVKEIAQENIYDFKILSNPLSKTKKLEVKDFVLYFRKRFEELKSILQDHSTLENLVSINKLSGNRQGFSLIGMVLDRRITKNKNLLLEIEDLTGKITVLINQNKKELYKKAEDIALDSVVGLKCSGSREIAFVNDIIFPEAFVLEKKHSTIEEYALFLGDLHFGSNRFLENSFLRFIDYLNGKVPNTPEFSKIKYLFIVGDLITGVGNYPNQERDLKIRDLEEQFSKIAELLGKIRRDIKIIICPGNHDGVRLMEPQPLLDEKYAWPLYNLKNVILVTNPCFVNIGARPGFSGFDVLMYHGFSFPHYANTIQSLIDKKAVNCPEEIMKYLLVNRHLAPTHASVQYFPSEEDPLLIKKIPDIFLAGHLHKCAVSSYNNILLVSASCWEEMTPYQEKFGNTPDHCKVPMLNLKTRAIKILDFEGGGE